MKKQTRGYVILGILALLVSVTAFAVPAEKTGAFWIAYAFTLAAIAAQIGTNYFHVIFLLSTPKKGHKNTQ